MGEQLSGHGADGKSQPTTEREKLVIRQLRK